MPNWVIIAIIVVLFIGLNGFWCYFYIKASEARRELEEQLFQYEITKDETSYEKKVVSVNKPIFYLKAKKTYPIEICNFLTKDMVIKNMAALLTDEIVRNKLIKIITVVNDDLSVTYTAGIKVLGDLRNERLLQNNRSSSI